MRTSLKCGTRAQRGRGLRQLWRSGTHYALAPTMGTCIGGAQGWKCGYWHRPLALLWWRQWSGQGRTDPGRHTHWDSGQEHPHVHSPHKWQTLYNTAFSALSPLSQATPSIPLWKVSPFSFSLTPSLQCSHTYCVGCGRHCSVWSLQIVLLKKAKYSWSPGQPKCGFCNFPVRYSHIMSGAKDKIFFRVWTCLLKFRRDLPQLTITAEVRL